MKPLEPDDYMRLLETDYRDVSKRASYERRLMVREIVEKAFPRPCLCLKLEDKAWSSMGEPSLLRAHGVRLARLTPWIELVQCTVCGTNWLHGANTDSGSYVATRLSSEQARLIVDKDAWPDAYDRIEHLWPDEGFLRWQKCASLEDWRRQNPVLPGDRCF